MFKNIELSSHLDDAPSISGRLCEITTVTPFEKAL